MYTIKRSGVQTAGTSVMPAFKPCFEEPNTFDRWIRRPSNLLHKMSGEELFWMASFAPRIKKYSLKRIPKIAFMFLTKGLLPLAPLWEKFLKGHEGPYRSIFIRCQHLKSNSILFSFPSETNPKSGKDTRLWNKTAGNYLCDGQLQTRLTCTQGN